MLLPGIAVAMGAMLVAAACGTAEPVSGASEARGSPPPATQPDASESTGTVPAEPEPTWQEPGWQEPLAVDLGVDQSWLALASGPAGLVAVSTNSVEDDAMTDVLISDDGEVWEAAATLEGLRLHDVTADGPGYVAVGSEQTAAGLAPVVATSPDRRAWDVQHLPGGTGEVYGVASTSVGLVAVGAVGVVVAFGDPELPSDAAAWHSPDGETWTAVPTDQFEPDGNDLREVVETGAGLLTIGHTMGGMDVPGALLAWRSDDGLAWVPASSPSPGEPVLLGGAAAGAAGAVVTGNGDPFRPDAWVTADGQAWQGSSLSTLQDSGSSFVTDVASDGVGFVAVGDDVVFDPGLGPATSRASIWTSPDGVSWRQVPQDDLAGPALLERGARASLVVHHEGRWLVFGTTTGASEDDLQPLLWVGLPQT